MLLGNRGVVRPEEVRRAAAKPAPKASPTPTVVRPSSLGGALPQQPFAAPAPSPRQAAQAQRISRSSVSKTPDIPRLPNPTPSQTTAALALATQAQHQSGQPASTYWRTLKSDPAQKEYVGTVQHYIDAARQHASALAGEASKVGGKAVGVVPVLPGLLASAARQTAQASAASRARAVANGEADRPHGVGIDIPGAGVIDLSKLSTALANVHIAPKGIVGNVINEAIDLPAQTFLSSAIAGSATRSAIEGKPGALKEIGSGVLQQFEHPVRSFKEAPLSTALTFAGGEAAVGGALGRVARAGALGERAAELASTVRPDLGLYGEQPTVGPVEQSGIGPAPKEGLRKQQQYNRDPLRKAVQVAHERSLVSRGKDPFQADGSRLARETVGGITKVGRVDRIRAAGEATRRTFVKGTIEKVAGLKPKVGADAVPLAVQGILRTPATVVEDLTKEATKLREVQPELTRSQLGANKANLKRVEGLLNDQGFLAHPEPAFEAAARYRQVQRPLEALLVHGGKLDAEQLRAKLFPYAQAHMGAVHDSVALRGPDGETLSNEAIKAHMAANGVEDVGFISHKPGIEGSGSFYKSTLRQPGLERFARTGAAFTKGVADHSFEGLTGSIARQASEAAQLEVRARELSKLALVPKGQAFESQAAAQRYATESFHHLPSGERVASGLGDLKPVHLGSDPILAAGHVNPGDVKGTLQQFGLDQYESALAKQNGKFGLIPDAVQKRLAAHDEALGAKDNLHRALQAYQQGFRRAKLNTSTRHIAGVVQEQGIRLGFEGAGNQARRVGKRFDANLKHLAQVDETGKLADDAGPLGSAYRELEGTLGSRGGQVAAQKANDVVRKGSAWQDTSTPGKIAVAADGAAHSTVGKALLTPWHAWQHLIEGGLTKVEQGTHHALLGKALRESGFIDSYRSVLKLQDEGMQALIKGGLTPNKADAIARAVDDTLGNWSHQTPQVRRIIGNYAPFGLWWLNSMRWLYRLPVTHPVKTAILSALYNATRNERNAKGQGYDAAHAAPGFLQGSIDTHLPIVGEVSVEPSYYSPGGTAGPEALTTAVDQLLPAGQSIIDAAKGQNPLTGEPLKDAKGSPLTVLQKALNVGAETAAGPLPFATQAQSLLQGGGKPYGTANLLTDALAKLGGPAQVKPGSGRPLPEQLVKLISPLRFNFPAAGTVNGGATSAGSGSALTARQHLSLQRRSSAPGVLTARQKLALQERR